MRKAIICLTALALALAAVSCGKKEEEASATLEAVTTESESETAEEETTTAAPIVITTAAEEETTPEETEEWQEERVEVDGKIRSYLTGEMVDVEIGNRRPLAIMISNDKAALPHYGINRAGVVYEAPVEAGMNRYMALIEDYDDLDRIGSVRSCRTYYVYFAREFDAVYAHFGQSTFAKPYLEYVDNINGIEGIGTIAYYRSKDRKAPHNAYASADGIKESIEKMGYRQEYAEDYNGHFRFAKDGEEVQLTDSLEAYKVVPGYVYNEPYFLYNEEDGLYYRYQYGAAHEGNEGPLAVKNIIIQYCSGGFYATTQYRDIDVHNPLYGYYITNGRAIPVGWEKDGEFGVTHYYNAKNEEITLNQGKTWICIVLSSDFGKTEIHGKSE